MVGGACCPQLTKQTFTLRRRRQRTGLRQQGPGVRRQRGGCQRVAKLRWVRRGRIFSFFRRQFDIFEGQNERAACLGRRLPHGHREQSCDAVPRRARRPSSPPMVANMRGAIRPKSAVRSGVQRSTAPGLGDGCCVACKFASGFGV